MFPGVRRPPRTAATPMKTIDDRPARAKAVKPHSPLPAASCRPPSHGPKTAPKRPVPEVRPTVVARLSGSERMDTVA
ncbi:hypothetical protein AQJ84_05000 [Streptomyces resistomycificus]|uniref:Uncharacterized protein n=1 Tax=Streptomyces resistomycificus TaxID=67356 RepID=A0A0L8L892_9ACTN|nr:hypothetical protein ADK37_19575 [Streptomyces resistomycificus]KUO01784.1 hypothetical protein AQJ84_05000 [Streptomyces resistomycificus]